MRGKAMSLKAKIKNIANKNNTSAQVVLQNYMFERFLERLSKSQYSDNFILKGGMLIASMIGIDNRATMDMDTTLRDFPLEEGAIVKAIKDICDIELDDGVIFSVTSIEQIRNDDDYGGYRVALHATYDTIVAPMHIDISTGDAITPKEVRYNYKMVFIDDKIPVWAYNIESVMAEKYETILSRGELSTRPRDYYDIYVLSKTQDYDKGLFHEALRNTSKHRESEFIFEVTANRIEVIRESKSLIQHWTTYTKRYPYASDIAYDDIVEVLMDLMP